MGNKEKTIDFFEIVKMIHPDFNPEIENPSTKMTEVTANKDDPETLYLLAVRWGLIEDDEIEKVEINYTIDRGKLVRINQQYEGIIIDFEQKKSFLEIIVHVNEQFRKFQKKDFDDQDENFYVIGYAPEKQYNNLDYKYQMTHGKQQPCDIPRENYDVIK